MKVETKEKNLTLNEVVELVSKAIRNKISIRFRYGRSKMGDRYGNPHVLYRHNDTNNLNIDIYQFDGVASNPTKLPTFKSFTAEHILEIELLENTWFNTNEDQYKPNSIRYKKVYEKV